MQIETVKKNTPAEPRDQAPNLRGYLWSIAVAWLILVAAGIVYSALRGVANRIAIPIIAAFLIEVPLYLAPFFESARAVAARLARWKFAGLLAATAVLPYLAYSLPTGCFNALDFYRLTGLAVCLSFWFLVVPAAIWSDLVFLAAPAAVMISRILKQIYWSPLPHEPIYILGQLMLIHLAALAILVLRGLKGVNPGLIPTRREAWIGARTFVFFLPVGFALVSILHMKMRAAPLALWKGVPVFIGIYLVTAFSEEFGFRGVLQQHLSRVLGIWPGLVVASALFGLAHLNFREVFPNWQMVALAGPAGLFYGWAYREAGSIRASMITHALTVVVWTLWLR
jgi:membrane protease YdiL (CAAX protease family)